MINLLELQKQQKRVEAIETCKKEIKAIIKDGVNQIKQIYKRGEANDS